MFQPYLNKLSLLVLIFYSILSHTLALRPTYSSHSRSLGNYRSSPVIKAMISTSSSVGVIPTWNELDKMLRDQESEKERADYELQLQGFGPTNAQSLIRLFDTVLPAGVTPESFVPEVTLYRDSAAWCPYCEKVWLQLEEKRIPYNLVKIPLRCYGDKPASFMRVSRTGGLPVATIKGTTISESNDIINLLEKAFPEHNPLWPDSSKYPEKAKRVPGLLSLERKVFGAWFQWLTSRAGESAASTMDAYLRQVDEELSIDSLGPYFLGEFSLVDIMFTPFLERMAASLPYFKGFEARSQRYPNLFRWYEAMDTRPAYQGIKSDYYTHCHDLPPQIGACHSLPNAKPFAEEIDGGAWSIDKDISDLLEPMIPTDANLAKREVVRRVISNHENLTRFALRGVGSPGQPSVSAPLADPYARPNLKYEPFVDESLRVILSALLQGNEIASQHASDSIKSNLKEVTASLTYLRDRIGVPRDMSVHAAKQFRSHINWFLNRK